MDDSPASKSCLMCAETIKAAAKICPFCQTRQGRFALWKTDLPPFGLALLILASMLTISFLGLRHKGRNFNKHREDLIVLHPFLEPAPTLWKSTNAAARTNLPRHLEENFGLIGTITNRGHYPWQIYRLEARFFDASNNLVEAKQLESGERFTVLPHQEHAFRFSFSTSAFTNIGTRTEVRVMTAMDPARLD